MGFEAQYLNWTMPTFTAPAMTYSWGNGFNIAQSGFGWNAPDGTYGMDTFERESGNQYERVMDILGTTSSSQPVAMSSEVTTHSTSTTSPGSSTVQVSHYSKMTDSELKAVYGNYNRDIRTKYNGTAADLDKYLKGKGVLQGMGQAFMNAQKKYGINASVLVAITVLESGHGKSTKAREKNNVGGVRISGSTEFKTYSSVSACIDDIARFLSENYVHNSNRPLTSLYQINAKYCPASDKTDKTGGNRHWAEKVEQITCSVERA